MKITIEHNINPDMDENVAGELLMDVFNPDERWGYTTRKFAVEAIKQNVLPEVDRKVLDKINVDESIFDETKSVQKWLIPDLNMNVFLHWDGDGIIVIQHLGEGWMLGSGDCKASSCWEWVDDDKPTSGLVITDFDAKPDVGPTDYTTSNVTIESSRVIELEKELADLIADMETLQTTNTNLANELEKKPKAETFIVKLDGTVAPLAEQWVKMSDRKPAPGRRVIYLTEEWVDDDGEVVDAEIYVGYYQRRWFRCNSGDTHRAKYVSHWKLLPDLP